MKTIRKITVQLFGALLFIGTVNAQEVTSTIHVIGETAPELTVGKWLKGGDIDKLEKGKVYVVEFWATWCLPCIAGMPHLSAIARKYKDVTVIGCSVLERKTTTLPYIEKFVAAKKDTMEYHVAVDEVSKMANNWLRAYGEQGIPTAFIVDKENRVAWVGHPRLLDKILPQVASGTWDILKAARERTEFKRLTGLDQGLVVSTVNPLMGNPGKPIEALAEIDKLLATEPGLKYFSNTGHFTFWSLIKTDPEKALSFGKAWLAANEEPRFSTITDAIVGRPNLPAALYEFAAYSYQEQLIRYPWSMNFPDTYKKMSELYKMAGNTAKADEFFKKSQTGSLVQINTTDKNH